MRYRIVLCGFSEFEYQAMHFSFQHPALEQESQFDVVKSLGDADFAIVDSDSQSAVKDALRWGRLSDSVFVGTVAPPGASWHLPRPIDPTRIIRKLEELTTRHDTLDTITLIAPGELRETSPRTAPSDFDGVPTLDDVVLPNVAPAPPAAQPPQAAPSAPAPTIMSPSPLSATHGAAKAAARKAARRARRASLQTDASSGECLRDVLVLDADSVASAQLCSLLERFGFTTHCVRSVSQASEQLGARAYAAVLMDTALDSAGLAFLEQIHAIPLSSGQASPAVLLMRTRSEPADRVRAALAGIAAPLIKPLSRGDVARALEDNRVALPSDERRS
jgi:CheY-like chemotaxis protein